MLKGQTHPSSIISKEMLAKSLIDLLQKKDYENITITELCAHAQIVRRTFYRNFKTIDDVLTFYIYGIIDEFSKELQVHQNDSYENIVIAYFSFWKRYADFLSLLNKNNLTYIIFTEYIKLFYKLPYILGKNGKPKLDENGFAIKLAYTSGGLWSLLNYWISTGSRQTPEELAKIVVSD
jgi:Transcriptional regulator